MTQVRERDSLVHLGDNRKLKHAVMLSLSNDLAHPFLGLSAPSLRGLKVGIVFRGSGEVCVCVCVCVSGTGENTPLSLVFVCLQAQHGKDWCSKWAGTKESW